MCVCVRTGGKGSLLWYKHKYGCVCYNVNVCEFSSVAGQIRRQREVDGIMT